MSFVAPLRVTVTVMIVALSAVIGFGSGTATACSCAFGDPVVAIGDADVVFTGTLVDKAPVGPDDGYHYDWTFEVDGVVKGEVESPQFVSGQEFGGGCGVNFTDITGSVTVYARRDGAGLASIGCSATPSAAELQSALDSAAGESTVVGSGPPSALAVGRSADANLFVLGRDGLPIARGRLPVDPQAVAHCAGTARAVVWSNGPSSDQDEGPSISGTVNVLSIVDLHTMQIDETRSIQSEFVSIRDQLECFDGGELVMLARGDGTDEGQVTVATSRGDGAGTTRMFENVTRAVIHSSGTVAILPSRAGEPIRTFGGINLEPVGDEAALGDQTAVVGAAFSADGLRLAVLVTSSGSDVEFDTGATGLQLLDVVDGVVQSALTDPTMLPSGDGRARLVAWLDDDAVVIERETDNSKIFDVVTTGGDRVVSRDVGWGWGLTQIEGSILRSRNGGLELVAPDLTSVPLVPSPDEQFEDGLLSTASVVDAPEMALPQIDGSALTIRPFEELPATEPLAPGTSAIDRNAPADSEREPGVASADSAAGTEPTVTAEPARNDPRGRSGPSMARGVIATLVLLGAFVAGLRRIREQRRTGRTSKFPRIG